MTLKDEIAEIIWNTAKYNQDEAADAICRLIGARQAEPSEGMKREGADYLPVTPNGATNRCAGSVYEAMSAQFWKDEGVEL